MHYRAFYLYGKFMFIFSIIVITILTIMIILINKAGINNNDYLR